MIQIQWHWFGKNRHALLLFGTGWEIIRQIPISRKKAEQLVKNGCSSGG